LRVATFYDLPGIPLAKQAYIYTLLCGIYALCICAILIMRLCGVRA